MLRCYELQEIFIPIETVIIIVIIISTLTFNVKDIQFTNTLSYISSFVNMNDIMLVTVSKSSMDLAESQSTIEPVDESECCTQNISTSSTWPPLSTLTRYQYANTVAICSVAALANIYVIIALTYQKKGLLVRLLSM